MMLDRQTWRPEFEIKIYREFLVMVVWEIAGEPFSVLFKGKPVSSLKIPDDYLIVQISNRFAELNQLVSLRCVGMRHEVVQWFESNNAYVPKIIGIGDLPLEAWRDAVITYLEEAA